MAEDPEVDYAGMVCDRIGVEHRVLQVRPPVLTELLDRISFHLEVPVANVNIIPTYLMYAAIRNEGFKVILIGEGSDEIFAGYPWHRLAYDRSVTSTPAQMFSAFIDRCGLKRSVDCLQDKCKPLLAERRMEWEREFTDIVFQTGKASLAGLLRYDQTHQLQFTQLQRIDRMSMSHGVEARVPFLYDPVLEAANRLPDRLRLRPWWSVFGRREKIALATSAKDLLPRQVLQRPKFGKSGTVNLWKTPLAAGLDEVFLQSLQSARFKESREALSEWIDWNRLREARLGNRERLLVTLLLMTVGHALRGYRTA
jgi:asparagine synthase (glutamine-hydrolysing)